MDELSVLMTFAGGLTFALVLGYLAHRDAVRQHLYETPGRS